MKMPVIAIALTLASAAAVQAAPLPSNQLKQGSSVTQVGCWWSNGARVCNGRRYNAYGQDTRRAYGAYPNNGRPEEYRVGSTSWWRAMDRDCRGGFRCR